MICSTLREIHRVTKHRGLVLITVPAYGFLWSEHDEALKHRRRYAAHELRNKLTVCGVEVVRTSYFISTLFFPILTLRIWQGLQKDTRDWLNNSLIPFGVSIVALARPVHQ